ncbi:LANO_0F06238g1_1 [Lachancea nothofagi CBS 11611]|uniref:LANO_0F06238g1_1 n=1 Tax=Lachancea nothofagi CBS 11611 TaxID=1266666 RepID=A0A1G4K8G0_9SACH|nr:LANO_0F06238g1_1 [Lachancea nothofagi CBS 11611]
MENKLLPRSRLDSLYSDFRRLKDLNPEGYDANIRSWKQFLLNENLYERVLLRCGSELLKELTDSQVGQPKSLDVALDALIAEGSLTSIEDFKRHKRNFILNALSRTLNNSLFRFDSSRTRISKGQEYLRDHSYVVVPTVERKYTLLEKAIKNSVCKKAVRYSDLIFTKREFCRVIGMEHQLSNWEEYDVMMTYMEHHKGLISTDLNTVKVCSKDVATLVSKFGPCTITGDDRNIASVKEGSSRLRNQISNLEHRLDDSKQLLVKSIQQKKTKDIQKIHLRTQKLLEKNLSLACKNTQNLEQVLNNIELAIDNVHLKDTFVQSQELMSSVSAQLGDIDDIEKLVDEINANRLKNEMVGDVLGSQLGDLADSDLDEELQKIGLELNNDETVLKKLSELQINSGARDKTEPSEDKQHAELAKDSPKKQPILSSV